MSPCSVFFKIDSRMRTSDIQSLPEIENIPILFLQLNAQNSNDVIMKALQKLIRIIEKLTDVLSGALPAVIIFLLMVMLLVEVLTRYIFNSPLSIAEEMGGYMLVSITFMGLAYTWKEKGHVRVTLLMSRLPERTARSIRFITLILATAFSVPLIKACYDLLLDSMLFESRSGSWLRTPLVYPQTILLVGAVLLFLQLLVDIVKSIIARDTPEDVA